MSPAPVARAVTAVPVLDAAGLRSAVRRELESRRFAPEPGCFADTRGGAETLCGLTGAVKDTFNDPVLYRL